MWTLSENCIDWRLKSILTLYISDDATQYPGIPDAYDATLQKPFQLDRDPEYLRLAASSKSTVYAHQNGMVR